MRKSALWVTAILLLLGALHTVRTRARVVELAHEIGRLERELLERERRNANLELSLQESSSPAALLERGRTAGLLGAQK